MTQLIVWNIDLPIHIYFQPTSSHLYNFRLHFVYCLTFPKRSLNFDELLNVNTYFLLVLSTIKFLFLLLKAFIQTSIDNRLFNLSHNFNTPKTYKQVVILNSHKLFKLKKKHNQGNFRCRQLAHNGVACVKPCANRKWLVTR